MNGAQLVAAVSVDLIGAHDACPAEVRYSVEHGNRNIPASAPANRKERRAIVKAIGDRQFKKLYRKAQA